MRKFVHTPEGVRDIYGRECLAKRRVTEQIHRTFESFGYEHIETPTFEFFDVFGREIGTTPSKELYKFFDKEGNTMVLRPDFTPSIGRCAAKYFMEEALPVRLAYHGNTFTNTSSLQGKLKEVTQMGVELIGDESAAADAEMIHMAVTALKAAGLQEFQVSIGEIEFFKGICEEARLEEETEAELREFISGKNYFGAEELLKGKKLPQEKIDAFLKMIELFGSYEILDEAEALIHNSRSKNALCRLRRVYELLGYYGDEKYVSFDLGMVSKYHYYTGIILKGYTYGLGDAVVTGGRYDGLLSYFGKDAHSIGFVINIDGLMQALSSRKLLPAVSCDVTAVLYEEAEIREAIRYAGESRLLKKPCVMYRIDEEHDEETCVAAAKAAGRRRIIRITDKGIQNLYESQET